MSETAAPQIVALGLDPLSRKIAVSSSKGKPIEDWESNLEKLMDAPVVPSVRIILCGPPPPSQGVSLNEMAQFLRMQYPEAALFFLTTDRTGFVRKDFVKNGFNDAFLMPLDSPTFQEAFHTEIARASGGEIRAFRSVKLVDVQPGQTMDFDTFLHLPSNGKHIKYSAAGDELDPERARKLAEHKVGNLHIQAQDVQKFYKFTAEQLKKLGSSESMSATEKRDRMQGAVRELISDMFQDQSSDASFERGKAVVKDCQEIVKAYIMTSVNGADNKWYEKLIALSQTENTAYTHSSNVATFAAMFSMALSVGNPEHLAMAGLLHDIGLSELAGDILAKPDSERSVDEKAAYARHPKTSVTLVQNRKMVVPEMVLKIIAQHHERFDGKGYPDQLRGAKVRPEAQLLAIADELVYLTAGIEGNPALSPIQAIQKIHDSMPSSGEDGYAYDPELVRKLYNLFKPQP